MYSYHNGEFMLENEVTLGPSLFSLNYAICAFEGLRSFKSNNKTSIFRLDEHVDRFLDSCDYLGLHSPLIEKASIVNAIKETVIKNGSEDLYLRPIAYYGDGIMNLKAPPEPSLSIFALPLSRPQKHQIVSLQISDHRRSLDGVTKKLSKNYFDSFIALKSKHKDFDDVLLVSSDGKISESSAHNIIFKKADGSYITPKSTHCLPGITRNSCIEIMESIGLSVEERSVEPEEIENITACFTTSTATDIRIVKKIDDINFDTTDSEIIELVERYKACTVGHCEQFKGWNSYV
jgi:branched-chain amino acid aminotransferase